MGDLVASVVHRGEMKVGVISWAKRVAGFEPTAWYALSLRESLTMRPGDAVSVGGRKKVEPPAGYKKVEDGASG